MVAIAASTGGPSALATVLSGLAGLQAPVLVVQHLHADFIAGLVEWMSRVSALPVEIASAHQIARARAGLPRAGGTHLRLGANRRLELAELPVTRAPAVGRRAVQVRRRAAPGRPAIGVLLTGMGDDGAQGLLAIRRQGGVTLAQDEASSAVFGMPKAAERLGAVTEMLPLDKLAAAIQRAVRAGADDDQQPRRWTPSSTAWPSCSSQRIGLRPDPTVRGRLQPRHPRRDCAIMATTPQPTSTRLAAGGDALQGLLNRVTVQETAFFRHPEHFEVLARDVLPTLPPPVRIWSAGCANGQEAFSLAMLLEEQGIAGSRDRAPTSRPPHCNEPRPPATTARELSGLSPRRIARHLTRTGGRLAGQRRDPRPGDAPCVTTCSIRCRLRFSPARSSSAATC